MLNSMNTRIYFIIFFLAIMAFLITPVKDLDLYQYYYDILPDAERYSIPDYIELCIATNQDFMYIVSLMFIKGMGLPIQLVNFFYVGLYYLLIFKILSIVTQSYSLNFYSRDYFIVIIATFFSALPILVFTISRTLAAIDILYIAIYYFLNKKYYKGTFFAIFSILFHVVSILFIFVIAIGCIFNYLEISQKFNRTLYRYIFWGSISLVLMFFVPRLLEQIQFFILSLNVFYVYEGSSYLNDASSSLFTPGGYLWYLRYGKPYAAFVMFICLVNIKKHDEVVNYALAFLLVYCFIMGNMAFVSDRLMMFMPFLYGSLILCLLAEIKERKRNAMPIFILMLGSFLISMANIYVERASFFGFL